ncbi:hypothetical protein [Apibacter sp. wkB309]|uniref:hypothetical protein n=1 Tax=Apibacter sp. wkB309 TaxID=1679467 RepID=UPI000CF93901|nr:hypothetical protein [Apibacter sp. wkB309]PQL91884.1 hypothetical protein C4S75_03600 [Apibacter sp. wkB309]
MKLILGDEFSKADLMKGTIIEKAILYPGSLLRGESFVNGNYDPLILTNSFNAVIIISYDQWGQSKY